MALPIARKRKLLFSQCRNRDRCPIDLQYVGASYADGIACIVLYIHVIELKYATKAWCGLVDSIVAICRRTYVYKRKYMIRTYDHQSQDHQRLKKAVLSAAVTTAVDESDLNNVFEA